MRRKILKLGYCTSVVALPREWIKQNNIKKGDCVSLECTNNQVIINKEKEFLACKIDMKKIRPWGNHYLCQLYARGYEEIEITNINSEEKNIIRAFLIKLPGTKIKEENKNNIIIGIENHKSHYSIFLDQSFKLTIENMNLIINSSQKSKRRN